MPSYPSFVLFLITLILLHFIIWKPYTINVEYLEITDKPKRKIIITVSHHPKITTISTFWSISSVFFMFYVHKYTSILKKTKLRSHNICHFYNLFNIQKVFCFWVKMFLYMTFNGYTISHHLDGHTVIYLSNPLLQIVITVEKKQIPNQTVASCFSLLQCWDEHLRTKSLFS